MSYLIRFICWLLPHRLAHECLRALTWAVAKLPDNRFLFCYTIRSIEGSPYIRRMILPRWRGQRNMLHWIHRPDSAEACHNHPWDFLDSRILLGGYDEYRLVSYSGSLGRRQAFWRGTRNRIDDHGTFHMITYVTPMTWTLVTAGKRVDSWGFMSEDGFVDHKEWFADRGYQPSSGASK